MPLVDVVLVLLIIFMLTAHVMEFGLEVDVPEVKATKETTEDLPVVRSPRRNELYLNEKPMNIQRSCRANAKRIQGCQSTCTVPRGQRHRGT